MSQPDVKIRLTADDKTRAAFASANGNIQKLKTGAASLVRSFGSLGAAITVGGLAAFAKQGIDAADALNDLSQITGVTVKDLASLKTAAEQNGTSLEDVGKAISKLSLSYSQAQGGNKAMAESLKRLGIDSTDARERLFQLADAYANSTDKTRLLADIQQVQGRQYAALIPLLSQGAAELRKSAQANETYAQTMARLAPDADKFNDQLAQLRTNSALAGASLLNVLVPAMNKILENVQQAARLNSSGFGFLQLLGLGVNPTQDPAIQLRGVNAEIAKIQARLATNQKQPLLQAQIEQLKQLQGVLQNQVVKGLMTPPARPGAPPPTDNFAQIECVASGGRWANGKCITKRTGGGGPKPTDQLASILSQTETAKLAEYEKLLGLLNARFEKGKISGKQYAEALTNLRNSTFTEELRAFNEQLAFNAETERMVADHLKATNDEIYNQKQAWAEAGRALEDEMRTPLENANIEFARLQHLLDIGEIKWETYARAVFKTSEAIADAPEKLKELDSFAKTAAENIQDALADFLFDPFSKGLDGMLEGFAKTIQRMVAEAIAADLAKYLLGDLVKGGSGGGIFGGFVKDIFGGLGGTASANGNAFNASGGKLAGFAVGGIASGPSSGYPVLMHGTEAVLPLKRGRNGKLGVESQGGGTVVHMTINTPDANSFRKSSGQITAQVSGALSRARRNM